MRGFPNHSLLALLLSAGVVSGQEKARVDALGDPLPAGAVARLGSIRLRPGMWVTHLAFSPDGKQLASWSEAGFSLWDAATGRELRRVDRHETRAFDLRWLKDGRVVAVLDLEDRIFVWDFTDPKATPLPAAPPPSPPKPAGEDDESFDALAVSPDGKYLAAGCYGINKKARKIDLFELVPGRSVKDLKRLRALGPQPGDCVAVAFTPDGRSLLAFSQENEAKEEWLVVYDLRNGEELRRMQVPATNPGQATRGGGGAMNGVHMPGFGKPFAVAPDGRAVAVGPADGAVSLWDLAQGKPKGPSPTPSLKGSLVVAFAENGRTLITAGYNSPIRVWDIASGRKLREFGREPGWVTAIAVSPDGRRVAVGGHGGGIRLWDVASGREICPAPGHCGPLWKVAVSPDGRTAVTTAEDNTLRLWDVAGGRERRCASVDDFELSEPVLTPDGKAVLTGGKTGLRLWDIPTLRQLPAPGALAKDTGLPQEFSADGRILLTKSPTRSESGVALWDWPAGTLRRVIAAPMDLVFHNASLSSDGRWVATVRWRGDGVAGTAVEFWDAATGRCLHEPLQGSLGGLCWVWFVPGQSVALVGDNPLLPVFRLAKRAKSQALPRFALWEVSKLQRRPDLAAPVPELHRHWEPMRYAAISADGRTLATALDGRAVTLFEVATGQVRRQLPAGHRGDITSLAFTRDGRRLISTSRDQTGLVWGVSLAFGAEPAGPAEAAPWDGLADANARTAYRAMARLAADPDKAVALLRERLPPVMQPDDAALDRLVTDLGDKAFAVRNRATAELDRLGHAVVPGVLARWEKAESLELRRRLEQFLDKHDRGIPPPEALRQRRALELLEQIDTASARAVLRDLAKGSPAVRLTQDAAAALRRLERMHP